MKSAWYSPVLFLLLSSLAVLSCKDNDDTSLPTPVKAGKGGSSVLQVMPIHDTVNVDSGMVYIKYNTDVVPTATHMYDDSALVAPYYNVNTNTTVNRVTFSGLKKGQYLLYSKSWDKVRSQTVSGSRPYEITTDFTTYNLELQLH